jgi:CRISPR-associated protein Cas2
MNNRNLYIVSYDIADDKRLREALKLVRRYATGGQKSVHECWMSPRDKEILIEEFTCLMDETDDGLLIVRLDPRQTSYALGGGVVPENGDWFYIG